MDENNTQQGYKSIYTGATLPSTQVQDYSPQIQEMYDAKQAAQAQQLETAYLLNKETLQNTKSQIPGQYNTQANDLATQYERNRRNNNMQADLNGLNTGTGSQMQLAQNNAYMQGMGQLRASQAKAETEADQQMAALEIQYKSAIAQALADNDYQKATALLAEYQRREQAQQEIDRYNYSTIASEQQYAYDKAMQDAKTKAAYGDFSGYAALYGQDTANAMQQYWNLSNLASLYGSSSGSSGSSGRSYRSGGSGGRSGSGTGTEADGIANGVGIGATSGGLTDRDLADIALAADTGAFGNNPYLVDAVADYRRAMADAEKTLAANGMKPGDPKYQEYLDAYFALNYDNAYVPADIAAAAISSSSANNQAYQQKLEEERARQKVADYSNYYANNIDPTTGMTYAELAAAQQDAKNAVSGAKSAISSLASALKGNKTTSTATTPANAGKGGATSSSGSAKSTGSKAKAK